RGQIVGFLGPNGAGKTTTLRILTGYLPPTSGRATIAGHNVLTTPAEARARIGYLPESTPLYPEMRVSEYLHFRGRLMNMPRARRKDRIATVCDRCGLAGKERRVIGHLSKGNRQRVGLAQALLHDPPVLILDEPTAGLDPNQVSHVRELIAELKHEHTVLISTHILPEVEKTADHVIIIAGGRIAAEGTPKELREKVASGAHVRAQIRADREAVAGAIESLGTVETLEVTTADGWTEVTAKPSPDSPLREQIGALCQENGWPLRELRDEGASLEQFFIEITARQEQASPVHASETTTSDAGVAS
ncbi:MAG: ATP-binding cassette domain-containing protein, partial [Phycisphaeraceae bacterium]|nr:ATP-binding cassette domain-containing protein [Phycisphaeraceae bacterium]